MRKFPALLAAAASVPLALIAFALPASASGHPISNATTVCGHQCWDVSTIFGGPGEVQNSHNGFNLGDRIGLRGLSDTRVNEDFEASFTGFVGTTFEPGTACFAGLIPPDSKLCLDGAYSSDIVWQLVGAPDSNATDLCVGVSAPAVGQKLRMEPCESLTTLWVADFVNSHDGGTPWINAADPSFSNPLVATVIPGTTAHIHDQMELTRENPSAGVVGDHQQIVITNGPAA
jgi:hypothetical protein